MAKFTRKLEISKRPQIGWREWISLPELGLESIKAKVDTGARSSCLHAFNIQEFKRGNVTWVRFIVQPLQHTRSDEITAEAPLMEYRQVRSSSGHLTQRPVIRTKLLLGNQSWTIDLTLTGRDEMGFRMLLGRQTLRKRFLIDCSKSFLQGPRTRN